MMVIRRFPGSFTASALDRYPRRGNEALLNRCLGQNQNDRGRCKWRLMNIALR